MQVYISDSSIFSGFRLDGNSTKLDDLHPYDYGGVTEIPVGILYSVFGGTRFFALGGGYFRLAPRVITAIDDELQNTRSNDVFSPK